MEGLSFHGKDISMFLNEFKNYLLANGYQEKTYVFNILCFINFVQANKLDTAQITFNDINSFVLQLRNKKLSNGYINNILKAVRCYYKFLILSKGYSKDILENIKNFKLLKVERRLRDVVSQEELAEAVGNGMTLFCKRIDPIKLRAVMFFMFYTGLRKGELVNLKREDVDLEELKAVIRIPVKNKSERFVYFGKEIKKMLHEYFISEPEDFNAFNMSARQVDYLIRKINGLLPTKKNLTAHSFRHSFANMLAEKDINVRVAQKLLGHKSMSSTLIYYDPDAKIVQRIYKDKIDVKTKRKDPKNGSVSNKTREDDGRNDYPESNETTT